MGVKSRRLPQVDMQLRAQIVSLRRAGMSVMEIGERLGLTRAVDYEAIRAVCDSLPRKYGFGELSPRGPVVRTQGARK